MRLDRPLPLLSWREARMQLGRNVLGATRYMLPNMLDNSKNLRNNAFIVGSLVLVCSRILVANLTALNAKGTPEGPYRYQEAMRTTLRESGGWVLSYAVLRQVQNLFTALMRRAYGIKSSDPTVPPTYISEVRKNLKAFFNRQPLDAPIRWVESANEGHFSYADNRFTQLTVKLLRKVPGLAGKEASKLIVGAYSWLPIAIGSIFSIITSGFLLEALTRDKSDQVIGAVSRAFHRSSPPSQPANTSTQPPNQFLNSMNSTYQGPLQPQPMSASPFLPQE